MGGWFDWFGEKTQDESITRKEKERRRQDAVSKAMDDVPIPGAPAQRPARKVRNALTDVRKGMEKDRKKRKK